MPRNQYLLAVDLGGTKLCAGLLTGTGKIVSRQVVPVDTSHRLAPVRQVAALASALLAGQREATLLAAGVAVPGLVRKNGSVWAPNLPGWNALPLERMLRRALGVPVCVESDRNAAVLGEVWRGAARGCSDAIVLMVGTGIGAGIISGGRLIRGAHELSGCAGWMTFADRANAIARRCGQLEAQAAGPAVARHGKRASAEAVADAARNGNRAALRAYRQAGVQLGKAVANLISLFDPETIVLTGGLMNAADLFLTDLRRTALAHAQPLAARKVRITVGRLGADANLYGVARLALMKRKMPARKNEVEP